LRLPAIVEQYGQIGEQTAEQQPALFPPYKQLTPAPAALHAVVLGVEIPVYYLADCAAAGGQMLRHLVVYEGVWRYAETLEKFEGLIVK
jgi:hypothetical protein